MALDPNEQSNQPIAKFEFMLKTDDIYFFDAEDFEDIIHHYLNKGKVSLAKKAIRIGLQQHPDAIELKLLEVEVMVFENRLEAAEKILDRLQLIDPHNEEIYIQRANILSKKDNHEAAVVMLSQALELSEDSFDIYSLLGMEYLFMDNFEQAKQNFMKCVDFDDQDYSSLYNVVYCFEFLEDYEGAVHYLNDYLERNPYCEVAWHQLGKQYVTMELYEEAQAAFDFAIFSDDTFIGAYFEKGKVLEQLGRYNEAIENYETTITIEDPTSHAYLRMGVCHEKLKNDDMAKFYYYKTVHEDPLLDKGWLAITDFYFRKKNYKRALFYINKAINIDGENSLYWKKCAMIHAALRHYDEADYSYKQSVDLGNYELETWMEWAEVVATNKEPQAAVQILRQGLEFFPDNAELEYILTGVHLMMDDPGKARNLFLKALNTDSSKISRFKDAFPAYFQSDWAQNIISGLGSASE